MKALLFLECWASRRRFRADRLTQPKNVSEQTPRDAGQSDPDLWLRYFERGMSTPGNSSASTAALVFTACAETWLESAGASGNKRESNAKRLVPRVHVDLSDQGEAIRAA